MQIVIQVNSLKPAFRNQSLKDFFIQIMFIHDVKFLLLITQKLI